MVTRRIAQAALFGTLLATVALGQPPEAEAYDWSTLVVDAASYQTSIAVDADGDPMIAYHLYSPSYDLRFAICDLSASAHGNCDRIGDWSTVTADAEESVGRWCSVAVGLNGDPMISYCRLEGSPDLKFTTCDRAESASGNCNQPGDWSIVAVDT